MMTADSAPACQIWDFPCWSSAAAGDVISKASNDALQQFVNNIFESFGKALASLGTLWVRLPSPVTIVDRGGSSDGGGVPAGAGAFEMILSYVTWVAAGIAVVSLIAAGVMMASRRRHGDGEAHLGRVGVILISVVLLSSASALVAGFLPQAMQGSNASSVVGWVQQHLQWYTAGLAILSILVAAARMAWTQRAEPLKELAGSVLTLIAVAGAGLVVIRLATVAGDEYSVSILNSALKCDVTNGESNCFGTNVAGMIGLVGTSPIGLIGLFLMGLLAVMMTYIQIALMVFRGAMLVILAAVFPVAASFTNTEIGKQWFKKTMAWTIAFILYKPAAATVYAAAFRLTGTDLFKSDGTGLYQIIVGLALMLIALIALPALMRFLVPAVAVIGSGGGGGAGLLLGGAAIGGAAEVATGAIRSSNAGSSHSGGSGSGPTGSGASAAGANGGLSPASGSGSAAAGGGSVASGAASSGAAGGATAGGGAAAGGAAAAAGPIGIGVAAAGKVAEGAKAAAGAVQAATADQAGSNENGN